MVRSRGAAGGAGASAGAVPVRVRALMWKQVCGALNTTT